MSSRDSHETYGTYGEYVVIDVLGRGGMGVVYKAEHPQMGRLVALKVVAAHLLDAPEAVDRFYREIRAIAQLKHPNVVVAYHAGDDGGRHYLVMEYIDGVSLAQRVRKSGPLPVREAIDYVQQAARGLAHAHEHGIVHRDVKPANLMLDNSGVIKLLDLGIARFASETTGDLSKSGSMLGTLDYMAPEQTMDSKLVDERVDVYSLGCTLYFLLSGQVPFGGENPFQKMYAHREHPIPSLREKCPELPTELDALYQEMLAKNPDDRLQSMNLVIHALHEIQESFPNTRLRASAVETSSVKPNCGTRNSEATEQQTADSDSSIATRPRKAAVSRLPSLTHLMLILGLPVALILIGIGVWQLNLLGIPFPQEPDVEQHSNHRDSTSGADADGTAIDVQPASLASVLEGAFGETSEAPQGPGAESNRPAANPKTVPQESVDGLAIPSIDSLPDPESAVMFEMKLIPVGKSAEVEAILCIQTRIEPGKYIYAGRNTEPRMKIEVTRSSGLDPIDAEFQATRAPEMVVEEFGDQIQKFYTGTVWFRKFRIRPDDLRNHVSIDVELSCFVASECAIQPFETVLHAELSTTETIDDLKRAARKKLN